MLSTRTHFQVTPNKALGLNIYDYFCILVIYVHKPPMPLLIAATKRLRRLFSRNPISDLPALKRALGVSSRTTVFHALSAVGYRSSYSHAGRYYTLANIPRFDDDGLWAHGAALFSRDKTLRATLLRLIVQAPAGKTHAELQGQLRLKVHNTLLDLVTDKQIGRAELEGLYLYVSADAPRAKTQTEARRHLRPAPSPPPASLSEPEAIIEILLAVIHHPEEELGGIVSLLRRQGQAISREQVELVWARYGLGKKKPDWKRSRR